ncbi:hypothetical protein Hanom_Chr13g01216681 [Helianthus anomalus]
MKDNVNTCYDCYVTGIMSSSESGLSDAHDPMVVVSDDEVMPAPEIYTSDTENFGDDLPIADGFLVEDPFDIPALLHDHLIIGHPDGEHIVVPILDVVPLVVIPPEDWTFDDLFDDDVDLFVDGPPADAQGDVEIDDEVVAVPPPAIPVVEISSDSNLHSVSDSFESVTSSALRPTGLQLYATDSVDNTAMSVAPSPSRVPTPPHDPEHAPELAPVPFGQPDVAPIDPEPIPDPNHVPLGLPDIAPLIPDPIPAPVDFLLARPFLPPPSPADVAPLPPVEPDVHRTDLPIVFLQDTLSPCPGEGTSGQPLRYDPFASAAFPPTTSFTTFTSTLLDEPFRWFPPYTMPISDP